jgi:hypothetical protein
MAALVTEAAKTFNVGGSYEASGAVSDNVGISAV